MKVFGLNFETIHYGKGTALAVGSSVDEAFQYLRSMGKFNATPQEYKLLSGIEVACATIDYPTLVYESIGGITTIKGPKGDKGDSTINAYTSMSKIAQYLYSTEYDFIDYDYAYQYFVTKDFNYQIGACASVREGQLFGRNFDWLYSNSAEFVVKTPAHNGIYAAMGIAGNVDGLTEDLADSRKYSELYRILPFFIQDGINETGLYCSMNVVPRDKGETNKTIPEISQERYISCIMVPRFILDHFNNAQEAAKYIRDYTSVFIPTQLQKQGYDVHYHIGDRNGRNIVVEFVNNKAVILENQTVLTNFHLHEVEFNIDGCVYSNEDVKNGHLPTVENKITPHGSGLERFNIIKNYQYSENLGDIDVMRDCLNSIKFSWAYGQYGKGFCFSDFVNKKKGFTVDTIDTDTEFRQYIDKCREEYNHKDRNNPKVWITTHSSIYNLNKLTLSVRAQEQNTIYDISLFTTELTPEDIGTLAVNKVGIGRLDDAPDYITNMDNCSLNIYTYEDYAAGIDGTISFRSSNEYGEDHFVSISTSGIQIGSQTSSGDAVTLMAGPYRFKISGSNGIQYSTDDGETWKNLE